MRCNLKERCVCCGAPFSITESTKPAPREVTMSVFEAMTEPPTWPLSYILDFMRWEGSRFCNYCHTRLTVSREAAEAL